MMIMSERRESSQSERSGTWCAQSEAEKNVINDYYPVSYRVASYIQKNTRDKKKKQIKNKSV